MSKPIQAWHWLTDDGLTRYEPRQRVEVGQTLSFDGEPILCEQGMHASIRALDALQYAPGALICRVELSGVIVHGEDKLVAQHRKCLWMHDATELLHDFACDCAEDALRIAKVEDKRSWAAIEAKRKWLRKEISHDELAAARAAAWAAAWAAAQDAAQDAARAAARAAARDAAQDAARAAARAAARDAAWAAARDAAWAAQNEALELALYAQGAPA